MMMFSPVYIILIYFLVWSLFFSVFSYLWWSGKRGYSF